VAGAAAARAVREAVRAEAENETRTFEAEAAARKAGGVTTTETVDLAIAENLASKEVGGNGGSDVALKASAQVWETSLCDLELDCYVELLRCPFTKSYMSRMFDIVHKNTVWEQPVNEVTGARIPRKTAWVVSKVCSCPYIYGGVRIEPTPFPPWMLEIMDIVLPICNIAKEAMPNSCNLNRYDSGDMHCGWHADDGKIFEGKTKDICIISLSIGDSRKFEGKCTDKYQAKKTPTKIVLKDGDICVMSGWTQKYYQHCVPSEKRAGARINMTWRWTTAHQPQCLNAGAQGFPLQPPIAMDS